jgi:hypothetical protein
MPNLSKSGLLLLGITLTTVLNSFCVMRELMFRLFLDESLGRLFRKEEGETGFTEYSSW